MKKITKSNLKTCLLNAQKELCKGEKVKVDLTSHLHSRYINYKMEGLFSDLMCIKENHEYYLARII